MVHVVELTLMFWLLRLRVLWIFFWLFWLFRLWMFGLFRLRVLWFLRLLQGVSFTFTARVVDITLTLGLGLFRFGMLGLFRLCGPH